MTHPYKHLENQKASKVLDKALRNLIANGDLAPLTPRPYIVGYLLEQLQTADSHATANGSQLRNPPRPKPHQKSPRRHQPV